MRRYFGTVKLTHQNFYLASIGKKEDVVNYRGGYFCGIVDGKLVIICDSNQGTNNIKVDPRVSIAKVLLSKIQF